MKWERWLSLMVVLFLSLALTACNSSGGGGSGSGDDVAGDNDADTDDLLAELNSAHGFAQKGPFAPGSNVTIRPLDEDGSPVGEGVSTTLGSYGEFRFEDIDWRGPSLITVEGDWFNESAGNFAGQPIALRSVVSIPEDEDEPSPFPTSVNVLTDAMADFVLQRMADGRNFDTEVTRANRELTDATSLAGDVRDLNLFALADMHPETRQVSGVFTKIMAALSVRSDVPDLLDVFADGAWDGTNVSSAFEDLWSELRVEAAQMIGDGSIEDVLTLLGNNYDAVDVSRQLSDQGSLGMVAACSQGGADEYGHIKLCLGQTYEFTLAPGDRKIFRFEAPYDGAFRFPATGGSFRRDMYLYTSRQSDGSLPSTATEVCESGCNSTLGTPIRSRGSALYVSFRLRATADNPVTYTIRPAHLNAGSPSDPRRIYPDRTITATHVSQNFTSTTGRRFSNSLPGDPPPLVNNHSYYRFDLGSGYSRVVVDQSPCGLSGLNSSVHLYRLATGDPMQAWNGDNLVAQANETSACSIELELDGPSTGTYWLKIINRRNDSYPLVTGTTPSGGTRAYHVYAD